VIKLLGTDAIRLRYGAVGIPQERPEITASVICAILAAQASRVGMHDNRLTTSAGGTGMGRM
jgi:hypothetical protein